MRVANVLGLVSGLLLLAAPVAVAGDAPDYCVRSRVADGFVPGKKSSAVAPSYPWSELSRSGEGWVTFEHSITPAGAPADITIRDGVGNPIFYSMSRKAFESVRFDPPTQFGKPVAQHLRTFTFEFRLERGSMGARKEVVINHYKRARVHLQANDPVAAIVELEFALRYPMTIYERSMASFLLAYAKYLQKDFATAAMHFRHSVANDGEFLEKGPLTEALALGVILEAEDGNYSFALCYHQLLKERSAQKAAEAPQAELAADLRALVEGTSPMVIEAQIAPAPAEGAEVAWRHPMLRERFAFNVPPGPPLTFRLACQTAVVEGPVAAGRTWQLPPGTGNCELQVRGPAGARFELIESR